MKQCKVFVVRKDINAENDAVCPVRYPSRVKKLQKWHLSMWRVEWKDAWRDSCPDMVQSIISVLDQCQAQQAGSNSCHELQTGIQTTAEEKPSSSLTRLGTELNPLFSTVQNLTPSLTTSTWSSDSVGERSRGVGFLVLMV